MPGIRDLQPLTLAPRSPARIIGLILRVIHLRHHNRPVQFKGQQATSKLTLPEVAECQSAQCQDFHGRDESDSDSQRLLSQDLRDSLINITVDKIGRNPVEAMPVHPGCCSPESSPMAGVNA